MFASSSTALRVRRHALRATMTALVAWFEAVLNNIPLPVLEVWGRFAFVVGLFLAICAFGGFTFRIGSIGASAVRGRGGIPRRS